jgi:hypothetical protein
MRLTMPLVRCEYCYILVPRHGSCHYISSRAPFSELPNTAAFLGGMVAQEVIKMVTKQYVPVKGYCVIDLIETWTGTIGA